MQGNTNIRTPVVLADSLVFFSTGRSPWQIFEDEVFINPFLMDFWGGS